MHLVLWYGLPCSVVYRAGDIVVTSDDVVCCSVWYFGGFVGI